MNPLLQTKRICAKLQAWLGPASLSQAFPSPGSVWNRVLGGQHIPADATLDGALPVAGARVGPVAALAVAVAAHVDSEGVREA